MKRHCKTRHGSVLLALLANCSLGFVVGAEPDKQDVPTPLPPKVVKAWRDAGFEVGWMKDVPAQEGVWGLWTPWREKGEKGAIPAFSGRLGMVTARLPDPGIAFGLDFHCGGFTSDKPFKELTRFKNLQSLNIGAVKNVNKRTQIDLKDLAGMTNLRALYLFHHWSVTDAQLKHVAALKNLQVLDLSATGVTDLGLKELAGLKDLQWLNLQTPDVTAKGVAVLQKELPKCKIIVYDD